MNSPVSLQCLTASIFAKQAVADCNILYFKLWCFFFIWGNSPPSGPGPPHSRGFEITHNDAPHSVIPLWTSDQPNAENYLTTHNTPNNHPCPRWDSNPQSQQESGRRPTNCAATGIGKLWLGSVFFPPGLNGMDLELTTILHLVPPRFRMSWTIDLLVLRPYALMAWKGTIFASILSLLRLRLSAVEGDTETLASSYPTFRCFPT